MLLKNRLFNLKEWLTIPETAGQLSIFFEEDIGEADVLRLALDRHLQLSVNFLNPVYGRIGKLLSYEDKEDPLSNFFSILEKTSNETREQILTNISGLYELGPFKKTYLNLDGKVETIEGVWDLLLESGQQSAIEHKYQTLTGGPEVTSPVVGAVFVIREGGQVCRLLEKFDEESIEYETNQGTKQLDLSNSFYPAVRLPESSVLVVRKQAIIALQDNLTKEELVKKDGKFDSQINPPSHPFYAKELQIAVEAWTELYDINPPQHVPPGGHKKYITKWLTKNHPSLSQRARDRITIIINPNPKGGASPTE